ncbi:lactate utilization protein B/C [Flavobacterium branchiophilum]|uniref:Lactate utilization protein B/C n=1 Tax=Flavobacterium branchiophilum TaxID=55197 RepID=A0A2H3KQS7_9FLAO|nr:lactate utilization protein B/C [Flavobacterium branchiophilum]PDS26868.1 lactate utilization protein B/C [Flavobacterium branchiophilum]
MNLFKKIFGLTPEVEQVDNVSILSEIDSEMTISIEERFVKLFHENGGKFIYCEDFNELREQFLNILVENDWFECSVLCFENQLIPLLEENKLFYKANEDPQFLFATCEGLIAEEGSILMSSNQVKHFKPNDLPKNIVIFSKTNQFNETKSDGLRAIKKKYTANYPSNIMAIKNFTEKIDENFMNYGICSKNLYLLLLEE